MLYRSRAELMDFLIYLVLLILERHIFFSALSSKIKSPIEKANILLYDALHWYLSICAGSLFSSKKLKRGSEQNC
jgi:hypothetical protein